MAEEIVNRVAKSGLTTLELENFFPEGERVLFDMKDWLFQEMVLKEKDFRANVKEHDWSQYKGKHVALHCSVDAIVPKWAYMLLAANLEPEVHSLVFGDKNTLETFLIMKELRENINPEDYTDAKVVVKGCSDIDLPESAYVEITNMLRPYVKILMYGEPCSTVPVYKKPRK